MPFFWPRVGKKDENSIKTDAFRQTFDEFPCVGADKAKIFQIASPLLFRRAPNPLNDPVDTNAKMIRMSGRVGIQKMTMAAADFENESVLPWKSIFQLLAKRFLTLKLSHLPGKKAGLKIFSWTAHLLDTPDRRRPFPASISTIRI